MTRVSVTTNGGSKVSVSGQPNTQEIRSVGIAVSENYGAISDQANLAIITAQAAFAQANTGNATPAFNQANAAYILANNSYIFANTILITAQGAFAQANAAPGIANSFSLLIGASSNTYATAVGAAGNSVSISIGTTSNAYATAVGVADNSTARAIGTSGNVYATSVGAAGNVYTLAAFNAANTAFAQGNNAYNFANTVLITAQAAFAQANAAPSIANTYATSVGTAGNVYASSVGVGANTYATAVGGAGNVYAVSVGIGANTYTLAAFSQANSAYILANNAYLFANTILPTAQGAFAKANGSTQLAFYRVNTAANNLTSSSNADILIVRGGGNIIVVGNTANQTLSIYDDQTTLIAAFAQANAAPGIANTYATAVGVADNSTARAIGTAGNLYATSVGTSGNTYATSVGVGANTYATAVGLAGNVYAASVGVGANTYATAVGTAGNVYTNSVGASANAWANTKLANGTGTLAGTLTVSGDFIVSGNVTLGDNRTDSIIINASTITLANNSNVDGGTLFIDATNNRVAIAGSAPTATLDVNGQVIIRGENGNDLKTRFLAGKSSPGTSNGTLFVQYAVSDPVHIGDGSVAADLYLRKGNIGINTASPSSNLHVVGTANITSNLVVQGIDVSQALVAGNVYAASVGVGANTYAASVGVGANTYATAVGLAGNVYAASVGVGANTYALAAFNAANGANNLVVAKDGTIVSARNQLNFLTGANTTLTVSDDSAGNRINVTIASIGGGGGSGGNVVPAYDQANAAYTLANNAYIFANTVLITAQGAFAKANGSTQLAFYRVNTTANNLTSSSNADTLIVRGGGNIIIVGNTANQTLSIYDDMTTLISAYNQANAAPGIANSYATAVGVADNSTARAIGTSGNTYATAVGTAGNLYATSVGTSGNTYAASVGVGANTYALAAFTAANVANNLAVAAEGVVVSTRNRLNFIQGSNVSISIADDSAGNRVNVTISSTAGGGAGGNVVPAFDKANSAYTLASGALANTPGVTFNGSISFVGTSGIPAMVINTSGIISMSAYDTGNVGIGTTNPTSKLQVNGAIFVTQANTSGLDIAGEIAEFAHNINSYTQVHLRNASAGANASGDFVITADTGTDSTDYLDLGLNSSGYADPLYSITGPRDGYLYAQSQNLAIGVANTSPGKVIKFFTGGTTASNEAMRITATGVGIGTTTPANTLHVVGNANISSNLAVQGLDVYTHLQNTKTTGVTPGTYGGTGNAVTITVDATGRLSLASVAAAPIIRQHFVDVAMINTASQLQNWFPTLGNVTVATGTVYYVDARLYLLDTATSHTVSLSVGGTAVVDWYNLQHFASTLANTTTPTSASSTTGGWSGPVTPISTAKVATVAGTTGHFFIQVQGLIAFAAGGTVRPAFSVSAIGAPVSGGVQNIKKGTYWSMSPVSANTANAIGPWGT